MKRTNRKRTNHRMNVVVTKENPYTATDPVQDSPSIRKAWLRLYEAITGKPRRVTTAERLVQQP